MATWIIGAAMAVYCVGAVVAMLLFYAASLLAPHPATPKELLWVALIWPYLFGCLVMLMVANK